MSPTSKLQVSEFTESFDFFSINAAAEQHCWGRPLTTVDKMLNLNAQQDNEKRILVQKILYASFLVCVCLLQMFVCSKCAQWK